MSCTCSSTSWQDLCAYAELPGELLGDGWFRRARQAELLYPYQPHWPCLLRAMQLASEQKLGTCCRATFKVLVFGGEVCMEMRWHWVGKAPYQRRRDFNIADRWMRVIFPDGPKGHSCLKLLNSEKQRPVSSSGISKSLQSPRDPLFKNPGRWVFSAPHPKLCRTISGSSM